jgi:hypothetical protein
MNKQLNNDKPLIFSKPADNTTNKDFKQLWEQELSSSIDYKAQDAEAYDGAKLKNYFIDEPYLFGPIAPTAQISPILPSPTKQANEP